MTFLSTLFDPGERICATANVTGTLVHAQSAILATDLFFSINPLEHSRYDSNVTCFRNILLEFDNGIPMDQLLIIDAIPHTTVVWSGNKSYHCIISLREPCRNQAEYAALVKRVYAQVPQADRSGKNPSRLSRLPGVIRPDTKQMQTLEDIGERVSRETLETWLGPIKEEPKYVYPFQTGDVGQKWTLPIRTKAFLEYGAPEGERNRLLFANACEMFRCGYTEEEIQDLVLEVLDLPKREVFNTIRSAKKKVGVK